VIIITGLLLVILFLYGTVIGSFVNVLIYRVPRGMAVSRGRSVCTYCSHTLSVIDLVPLFSYIFLKGRCRYCGAKITIRYSIVELLNGLFYMAVALKFGFSLLALGWFIAVPVLIAVAFIDADHKIIPDRFPAALAVAGAVMILSGLGPDLLSRIIGVFSVSIPLFLIGMVSGGRAMGGGDVKLMAAAGLCLGWEMTVAALFIGAFAGSIVSIVLMAAGKITRKAQVPFGPSLSLGIVTSALAGEQQLSIYLSLLK